MRLRLVCIDTKSKDQVGQNTGENEENDVCVTIGEPLGTPKVTEKPRTTVLPERTFYVDEDTDIQEALAMLTVADEE